MKKALLIFCTMLAWSHGAKAANSWVGPSSICSDANVGTSSSTCVFTSSKAFTISTQPNDIIYFSTDYVQTATNGPIMTSVAPSSGPVQLICVSDWYSNPSPVQISTGATISITNNSLTMGGFFTSNGISYSWGNTSASGLLFTIGSALNYGIKLSNATISTSNTNATGTTKIQIGSAGGTSGSSYCEFSNIKWKPGNSGQTITPVNAKFYWHDTPGAIIGPFIPTTLIAPISSGGNTANVEVYNVDLSTMNSGHNLVNVSQPGPEIIQFRNDSVGSAVSVITGAIPSQGGTEVYLDNCDSAATSYRMEHYKFAGNTVTETTRVRTDGASDGTTPISWKITVSTPTYDLPFVSPPIIFWNNTVGTPITATIQILHDGVANLQNNQIWAQAEVLTSTSTLGANVTNSSSNFLAMPADQATSTYTWTTSGMSNPNAQQLALTFTAGIVGPVLIRVYIAKTNDTFYIDPVNSSMSSGRQWLTTYGKGAYINGEATGGSSPATVAYPF